MGQLKVLGIVIIGLLVVATFTVFTVSEKEKAIMFQLGKIVRTDFTPGLHFRIPIAQNVKKFDSRILTLDAKPEEYLTNEKKYVVVDSFVKWRISDVSRYYTTMGGDEARAADRLSQIVKDGLRAEFAKRSVQDAISGERSQIMDILLVKAKKSLSEFGIEVVDVRIKRIDWPGSISESVYRRMEAERARVAKDFRGRGEEAAERIRADGDRQREVILAEAYRDAEVIRGEGDARAANIYATAYNKNREFYAMYKSFEAYRKTFSNANDILVLEPDSEFFRYFSNPNTSRK